MTNTRDIQELGQVQEADVYKGQILAATLTRTSEGVIFDYTSEYISSGLPPVAYTLPISPKPQITAAGGVPPFFAGLLPEGRRLQTLQRVIKTSADDELSLLLAVGRNTIGNVQIVPHNELPTFADSLVEVRQTFDEIKFSDLINEYGNVDRVGIPGVQEKVSASRISLAATRAGSQFILKLESSEHPYIIENEDYFLKYARKSIGKVARTELVQDLEGKKGLLVTRFDRALDVYKKPISLAVEDACQVLGQWPANKYNVSAETLVKTLSNICSSQKLAARELFRQFCFAWLTGNGDLHAKNISILSTEESEWEVAPAYDLLCTLPYERDPSLALTIGGKKTGHSRRIFIEFGIYVGLSEKLSRKVLDETLESTVNVIDELKNGFLPFNAQIVSKISKELRHRRLMASERE